VVLLSVEGSRVSLWLNGGLGGGSTGGVRGARLPRGGGFGGSVFVEGRGYVFAGGGGT